MCKEGKNNNQCNSHMWVYTMAGTIVTENSKLCPGKWRKLGNIMASAYILKTPVWFLFFKGGEKVKSVTVFVF